MADERSEQRRAAEALREQATERIREGSNEVRYGWYAPTWDPACAPGGRMNYPTMPPWCPPQGGGGGGGMTFPPICGPQAGPPPTSFECPTSPVQCQQPAPQQQVGLAWTQTGTVVEPRCFFPTQQGDTCPARFCGMLDSIFVPCPPRGTAFHQPPCIKVPPANTRVGDTCPQTICTSWHVGCRHFPAVGAAGPTPTATFPPVCYQQPAQQAAQLPTIYPNYTCGFVCNTQFCAPQQFAGGGAAGPTPTATFPPVCYQQPAQPAAPAPTIYPNYTCGFVCNTQFCAPQEYAGGGEQAGARFQGTLVSPRCLRTIDIEVCQPTRQGDTCPPTICTMWGIGCPRQPMWQQQPQQQQQQQQQVGAFTATITMTFTPRCTRSFVPGCVEDPGPNTVTSHTCPQGLCTMVNCGIRPMNFAAVGAAAPNAANAAQIQPTIQFVCQPTLFGATCPVCPPTLYGHTCPQQQCFPTLSGNTCSFQLCHPTLFERTCAQWQCQPTLFGATCPWIACRPTVFNPQCQFEPGPVIPQPDPVGNAASPTVVGQTCPFFICQPTFNFCPPQQ
jgi:hypothetical protein